MNEYKIRYFDDIVDDDNCEQIGFCFKKKEIINEYGTCKEFEFE